MSDERQAEALTPEEIAQRIRERRIRSAQKLVGSSVVGLFGMFKMATVPGPVPPDTGIFGLGVSGAEAFWVVVVLVAFGVVMLKDVMEAVKLGRGG